MNTVIIILEELSEKTGSMISEMQECEIEKQRTVQALSWQSKTSSKQQHAINSPE